MIKLVIMLAITQIVTSHEFDNIKYYFSNCTRINSDCYKITEKDNCFLKNVDYRLLLKE